MSTHSNINSTRRTTPNYRSTPPPPPPLSTSSSSPHQNGISSSSFYPGFLASKDQDDDEDEEFNYPTGSPSSSSSTKSRSNPNSPLSPGLPYLVDSPKPASSSSSSTTKHSFPSKTPSPSKGNHHPTTTGPTRSKSTPLGLEIGRETKSPGKKKRPVPLNLAKAREKMGVDEEVVLQREGIELQRPLTANSIISDDASSLSNELQDLSLLRKTIRQNLKARPLDSPLAASDSERESNGFPTPDLDYSQQQSLSTFQGKSISINDTLKLLQSSSQLLIIDTRTLGSFLDSHLPRSANISIPSLIFKRLRKSPNGQATSWDSLGGFVSTQAGRSIWDGLELDNCLDVVIVGQNALDELAKVLYGIMSNLVEQGSVKVLQGGWGSVMTSPDAVEVLVAGETSTNVRPSLSTSLPQPKSAPAYDISPVPPPIPQTSPSKGINHRPSMPSLRPEHNNNRRNLPSLSITGGSGGNMTGPSTSRRTPKLSLNLDKPLKSATLGSFNLDHQQPPPTPGASLGGSRSNFLSVDTRPQGQSVRSPRSPGFKLNIPKAGSFHTLCHAQSKLPPSPSSFGDVKHIIRQNEDIMTTSEPRTPLPGTSVNYATVPPNGEYSKYATRPDSMSDSEDPITVSTAKNGIAPFIVSTILPSFLYLGPEISSQEDVEYLKKIGVKRILNVAIECNDDFGLGLKDDFKYHRIPMRDIVEESGVAQGMRESCGFLDDARLHSAPTYVHCKAGKSRSVTVVLAYLIHANAWTLKTSYAYVAERRKGISPNIGFVAELMQFEEVELGLKQSGGVHGESTNHSNGSKHGSTRNDGSTEGDGGMGNENERRKQNNRTRESLPPTWSHSLNVTTSSNKSSRLAPLSSGIAEDKSKNDNEDEDDIKRRQVGDEREVRKNGQWVHHRRAPVDRTTLQPGRRVSKAGLESLRPLNTTSITSQNATSPKPSPGLGVGVGDKQNKHSVTPAGDGPLKWV